MEGLEGAAVEGVRKKNKEHLVSRQKKRRAAKSTQKALDIKERITKRKGAGTSKRQLRKASKDLW